MNKRRESAMKRLLCFIALAFGAGSADAGEASLIICPNPQEALWYSNDLAAATQLGLPFTYDLMERIRQKHSFCRFLRGDDIRATGDVFSGVASTALGVQNDQGETGWVDSKLFKLYLHRPR